MSTSLRRAQPRSEQSTDTHFLCCVFLLTVAGAGSSRPSSASIPGNRQWRLLRKLEQDAQSPRQQRATSYRQRSVHVHTPMTAQPGDPTRRYRKTTMHLNDTDIRWKLAI